MTVGYLIRPPATVRGGPRRLRIEVDGLALASVPVPGARTFDRDSVPPLSILTHHEDLEEAIGCTTPAAARRSRP